MTDVSMMNLRIGRQTHNPRASLPQPSGTRRSRFAAVVCLMAAFMVSSCTQLQTPNDPVVGSWQGQEGAGSTASLTLYGNLQTGSGRYDISTMTVSSGSQGSTFEPWSGAWVRGTKPVNGRPQTVIYLKNALYDHIDRYSLDRAGILEPTN